MKILYTGIGCNSSGEHTESEFLDIMNREFTYKDWSHDLMQVPREYHYQLQFEDWYLPDEFVLFTLYDWIDYSGALIINATQ
jgi:hypothetical protein